MKDIADIAPQIGKLVKLFSSPVDGEALAAVRGLQRTLAAAGADFHDLAEMVESRDVERRRQARKSGDRRYGDEMAVRALQAEAREKAVRAELAEARAELAIAKPDLLSRGWIIPRVEVCSRHLLRALLDAASTSGLLNEAETASTKTLASLLADRRYELPSHRAGYIDHILSSVFWMGVNL